MAKVALVENEKSYDGTMQALEMLGDDLGKTLSKQELIVVKINFVVTNNELATTPSESVRAFVEYARNYYKGKIVIAEEATSGNTLEAMEKYGFVEIAKNDENTAILNSGKIAGKKVEVNYLTGKIGLTLSEVYLKPNYVVSIMRAKTHDSVVVTLSLKNLLVGAIKHGFLKNRFRIHIGKRINQILAGLCEHLYPDLGIVDGVIGMEGNGPAYGTPIKSGWVAVSSDPLLVDSLATYLMGFDIKDVGYLNLIRENNKGKVYPTDVVEVVGEDPKNLVIKYKPHKTFEKQRMWRRK